jgi:hypothetical protein
MSLSMHRSINLTVALAAVALLAPAAAPAKPAKAGKMLQFVAPKPVVRYDKAFTVAPNTTQTFRMAIPALDGSTKALQVPCWGFDLVGPGMDLAAAGLQGFGWIAGAGAGAGTSSGGDGNGAAVQDASGAWVLPDSDAALGSAQWREGQLCRTIAWDVYVDPKIDGPDSAVARAERKARRTHLPVAVNPRHKVKTRRANVINDNSVTVSLAGMRYLVAGNPRGGVEMVVTLTAGDLAGPTTLTTHARVTRR